MRGHTDIIFARRLRKLRRQAKVTQRELAGQMTAAGQKILPSAICNIEIGRRLVTIGEAVQFAAALGIPLQALLTDGPPHNLIEAQLAVHAVLQVGATPRHSTRPALEPATDQNSKWGPRPGAPQRCCASTGQGHGPSEHLMMCGRLPHHRAGGRNRNRLTHLCPQRGKQSPAGRYQRGVDPREDNHPAPRHLHQ
jgi:transcriptional regulator with XRE-family HTH domain